MARDANNEPQKNRISEPREVALKFGYEDKSDESAGVVLQKDVTFGRRPTGKDFLRAAAAGDGTSSTRYMMAMVAAAITKFGTLRMPVALTVLLALNKIDREKLLAEYLLFSAIDAKAEQLGDGKVKLIFGITRDGIVYDTVEFGHLLSGYDEITIEETTETVPEERAFKMALEVVRIAASDGSRSEDGALTREDIEAMDFDDFIALQAAEEDWLNSFRK